MTTPLDDSATARDLLFGATPGTPAEALTQSLHEHGTVGARIRGLPGLADTERAVAEATDGLLSLSLVDLLTAGWKKYGALRQAAVRTRAAPHTEETVVMATHRIDSRHQPCVELYVNGTPLGAIEMALNITFTLAVVRAVVKQARLTAIKSGTCTVAGSLTIAGTEAAKTQRSLDLAGTVRLRHGIALLETDSETAQFDTVVVGHTESPTTPRTWYADPTRR
jgi:hypothetical protein